MGFEGKQYASDLTNVKAGLSALGLQHEQINLYPTGSLTDEQQAQAI